jgi:hypothetical protein
MEYCPNPIFTWNIKGLFGSEDYKISEFEWLHVQNRGILKEYTFGWNIW